MGKESIEIATTNNKGIEMPDNISRFNLLSIIAVFLIIWVPLLIAGSMDYEEAQNQDEFYCEMVREGSWPDYKNLDCEEDNGH